MRELIRRIIDEAITIGPDGTIQHIEDSDSQFNNVDEVLNSVIALEFPDIDAKQIKSISTGINMIFDVYNAIDYWRAIAHVFGLNDYDEVNGALEIFFQVVQACYKRNPKNFSILIQRFRSNISKFKVQDVDKFNVMIAASNREFKRRYRE